MRKLHYSPLAIVFAALITPSIQPLAQAQHTPCCGAITPAGERLAALLDGMHVESLWLANEHVNWETGEPDRGAGYEGPGRHTHCSAFAAAVAKKEGVYLLHPPEHGQSLLSNAQAKWLLTAEGKQAGWRPVTDMHKAQHLANEGNLVIVIYENPNPKEPGHIAIVRPSEKSARALEENGPETIQAGEHNHNKTNVRIGFENHPGAFPSGVRYYVHSMQ